MKLNKKVAISSILCVSGLVLIVLFSNRWFGTSELTRDFINELIDTKGAKNLTWANFDGYPHSDVGSGNYVYEYNIKGGSHLYLSGTSLTETPMYIYILDHKGNREDIFIKTES